jgi:hypothetical protein
VKFTLDTASVPALNTVAVKFAMVAFTASNELTVSLVKFTLLDASVSALITVDVRLAIVAWVEVTVFV